MDKTIFCRLPKADVFQTYTVAFIILITVAFSAYYLTPNRYLVGRNRSELPQYQFAEIINQNEDATLLNYGFLDGGFYTVADVLPSCRYFCKLNLQSQKIIEIQNSYIYDYAPEFVVSRSEIVFPEYELVAQSHSIDNGVENILYYYLYQRK